MNFDADVIIVGGGPAGLSAALVLARACRTVLIFDHGHPRNAATRHMHGFLSREGIPPGEFLRIAREDLKKYDTVRLEHAEVREASCVEGGFEVTLTDGRTCRSKQLLVATGVEDNVPDVPGLRDFYGTEHLPLPVLRRLGAARPADRGLRPRPARARAVDGDARLDARPRALHRRPCGDRPDASCRTGAERHPRSAKSASCASKAATASSNASSSSTAIRCPAARCSSRPASTRRRRSRAGSGASSTRRARSTPDGTRRRRCPGCTSPATRHATCSGSSSPPRKAPKRRSRWSQDLIKESWK